jgi:aspartate/methionine/tyrosine aminotransferase
MNPYVAAQQVHTPALILGVWIFGGILAVGGAFIWAELAATMPEVGGQYAYLRDAYHPMVAFLYGWVLLPVIQTGVTSSLTKAYGLSGIRCGWILAQAELVQRMWQVVDFTYGSPVHPAERLGVIALDNLDRIRNRAHSLLETNRSLVNVFLADHPELDCEPSRFGTTVFPRLNRAV